MAQWPIYLAYIISFVNVLLAWIGHHSLFKLLRKTNNFVMLANGLLLASLGVLGAAAALVLTALDEMLAPHIYPAREDGGDPRQCPVCGTGRLSLKIGKFGAFIGCSNYPAWRLVQALWSADRLHLEPFVSLQPNYSLALRNEFEENGLNEICQTYGLGVIPYSPLAGGFLTGKYRREGPSEESMRSTGVKRFINERSWETLEVLRKVAEEKNASPSQVALAWLLRQPSAVRR